MDATAFQSLMTSLVRDDDGRLSPEDVSTAVGLVINRYNADKPRTVTEDREVLEGLVIDTPEAWVNQRSKIVSIEAPIGRNPPSYVLEDYYYVYNLPDGDVDLRLLTGVVSVGELCRVCCTSMHTTAATFDEDDCEELACFGAAILCDQLAAIYSHESDPTIAADTVNHADKSRRFSARASAYRARYESKFGKPTSSGAASTIVQHPRRNRSGMFSR